MGFVKRHAEHAESAEARKEVKTPSGGGEGEVVLSAGAGKDATGSTMITKQRNASDFVDDGSMAIQGLSERRTA